MRKCINVSEKDFKSKNLLLETIPVVADILGETFPELREKLSSVLDIVEYEQELLRSLRDTMSKDVKEIIKENPKLAELEMFDYPGFVAGFQEFRDYRKSNPSAISGDFMYRLHSTFGYDVELMEHLAELEGMTIDKQGFDAKMAEVKKDFNAQLSVEMTTALDGLLHNSTDNDFKYEYSFDSERQLYRVEPLKSTILSIFDQSGSVASTDKVSGSSVRLVTLQSPFYYESGGQESDAGYISKNGTNFHVKSLSSRKNCVLHEVELTRGSESLKVGDEVQLHVDQERRSSLIRNHSAAHLLNSAMRRVKQSPIYQKSSLVTSDQLKIELACLGPKISVEEIEKFEELIRLHIKERPLERKIRLLNSQELQSESGVVMVPGEVYPDDGIRLVTFGDFSKELCCGTHVFNTSELQEFAILSMRSPGRSSYVFTATTGPKAIEAMNIGEQSINELKGINQKITAENFQEVLAKVREVSIKLNNSNVPVAYLKKLECQNLTAEIKKKVKLACSRIVGELLDIEMKSVLEKSAQEPFIVHFLSCSDLMKSVPLFKATQYIQDRPVMILSLTDHMIKARCCVPERLVSDKFDAEMWIGKIAPIFSAKVLPPKEQNPKEAYNMKDRRVHPEKFEEHLKEAMSIARQFAKNSSK